MDDSLALTWAPKAAVYIGAQLAIGIAVARRLSGLAAGERDPAFARWLARLAMWLGGLLLVGSAAKLLLQTASAFGLAEAISLEPLRTVAMESRWGARFVWQALAATLVALTSPLAGQPGRAWAFDAAAITLVCTLPWLGHAAGDQTRQILHAAHGLAAAAWIGTLGVIAMTAWRRPTQDMRAATRRMVERFSPVAMSGAALAAATGVVAATWYVGTWPGLWSSPYGRVLLVKVGAVLVVALCGALNWRRARRGDAPRRGLLTLEWAVALGVVLATGLLTETEHP